MLHRGLALVSALVAGSAYAVPITFDFRDPYIETIDEVESFALTRDGLTATVLAAGPVDHLPEVTVAVLNQTTLLFNEAIFVQSVSGSNFESYFLGRADVSGYSFLIESARPTLLPNVLLEVGQPLMIGWVWGNGFSLNSITVERVSVPEPTTLLLLSSALAGFAFTRRRRN